MTTRSQPPNHDDATSSDAVGMPTRGMIDARGEAGSDARENAAPVTGEMPRGEMNAAGAAPMTGSDSMPGGAMTTSQGSAATDGGDMPSGAMASAARAEQSGVITLPGVWRLTFVRSEE